MKNLFFAILFAFVPMMVIAQDHSEAEARIHGIHPNLDLEFFEEWVDDRGTTVQTYIVQNENPPCEGRTTTVEQTTGGTFSSSANFFHPVTGRSLTGYYFVYGDNPSMQMMTIWLNYHDDGMEDEACLGIVLFAVGSDL